MPRGAAPGSTATPSPRCTTTWCRTRSSSCRRSRGSSRGRGHPTGSSRGPGGAARRPSDGRFPGGARRSRRSGGACTSRAARRPCASTTATCTRSAASGVARRSPTGALVEDPGFATWARARVPRGAVIVSFEHRFAFIKVQKTAGTSVEVVLSQVAGADAIVTPINPPEAGHQPRNYEAVAGRAAARAPLAPTRALGRAGTGARLLQPHARIAGARPHRRARRGTASTGSASSATRGTRRSRCTSGGPDASSRRRRSTTWATTPGNLVSEHRCTRSTASSPSTSSAATSRSTEDLRAVLDRLGLPARPRAPARQERVPTRRRAHADRTGRRRRDPRGVRAGDRAVRLHAPDRHPLGTECRDRPRLSSPR